MSGVAFAISLWIGCLLVASGVAKIPAGRFTADLANYQVLPTSAVIPVARTLPWLEATVGLGLLLAPYPSIFLVSSAVLLALFGGAVAVTLLRGRKIPCGCRGADTPVSWHLVVANLSLAIASLLLAFQRPVAVLRTLLGETTQLRAGDAVAISCSLALAAITLRVVAEWRVTTAAQAAHLRINASRANQ